MNNKIHFIIAFTLIFSFAYSDGLPFNEEANCQPHCCMEICEDNNSSISHDEYRYVSVGVGPIIFIPNVGIGYRKRDLQVGWDTGLSISSIGYLHQLSAYLVGHYYLNPSKSSPYLGLGLIGSGVFTNHKDKCGTLSPDFVFGKHLKNDDNNHHFIEMHVAIPTVWIGSKRPDVFYLPLMYVKYGISF